MRFFKIKTVFLFFIISFFSMQRNGHIVYRILVTVIVFTAFSRLSAQEITSPNTYTSGNGAAVAKECSNIIKTMQNAKTACYGADDAAFTVAFRYDVGGDYYFCGRH